MGEIRESTKQWLIFRNRERAKRRKPKKKGWDSGGLDSKEQARAKSKQANEQFAHV